MANTTDVREWAKTQGIPVGDKGKIRAELHARYEAEHGGPRPEVDFGDDDDVQVDDADFEPDTEPAESPAGDAQQADAEARPRRIRRSKGQAARSFRERVWGGEGSKAKRPAKKHPRVSLKGFAEDAFLDAAWAFQAAPPLEKILYLEAPIAGQIVEDTFKGTIVDKALQPAARVDRQFKALEGLTAPLWVAAIMAKGRKDDNGNYSPQTVLMFGGLRHALLSMSRSVEINFDEQREKAESLRSASGDIDRAIAWLFEMPGGDDMTEEQLQAMAAMQQARAAASQ